jgi:hypothetical protein
LVGTSFGTLCDYTARSVQNLDDQKKKSILPLSSTIEALVTVWANFVVFLVFWKSLAFLSALFSVLVLGPHVMVMVAPVRMLTRATASMGLRDSFTKERENTSSKLYKPTANLHFGGHVYQNTW